MTPADHLPVATLYQAGTGREAFPPRIRPVWPGARLRGPAYPVRLPSGDNLGLHHAIYDAPEGAVLVAVTGDPDYAYWGHLMTRAAMGRGLGGMVIDGGVRDVELMAEARFPVFAAGFRLRSTSKRTMLPAPRDGGVELDGGVRVSSGDLVVADADGVIAIARDRIDDVLARARLHDAEEAEILRALEGGEPLPDLLDLPGAGPDV